MKRLKSASVAILAISMSFIPHSNLQAKSIFFEQPVLEEPEASETIQGLASWYSERDPGIRRHTANNEIFDDSKLTCAIWDVPFGQKIKVTNLHNGKSVIVRVNDRGPHKRFVRKGRVIDLTKAAFRRISGLKSGLIKVELEML